MIHPDILAAQLRELAERVLRLRGISATRPHIFLEGKNAIARALEDLAVELIKPAPRPASAWRGPTVRTFKKGRPQ